RTVALAGTVAGAERLFGPCMAAALENSSRDKWQEAVDEYQRLLLEEGDALVPLAKEGLGTGLPSASHLLRRICHQRLAQRPAAFRKQYPHRVDAEAQKLFEE